VPSSTTVHSGEATAGRSAGEGRGAAPVEIALEPVADGLVQQHAGPARPQHHRHGAGRRRHRLEVDQRLARRLARELLGAAVLEQPAVAEAPAAAGEALLAAPVLLGDHRDVDPHQRPHVGGQRAVAGGHQDQLVHADQADHHLAHPRVDGAGDGVEPLEQRDLLLVGQRAERIEVGVQGVGCGARHACTAPLPPWRVMARAASVAALSAGITSSSE
jgi:hypothetical protein